MWSASVAAVVVAGGVGALVGETCMTHKRVMTQLAEGMGQASLRLQAGCDSLVTAFDEMPFPFFRILCEGLKEGLTVQEAWRKGRKSFGGLPKEFLAVFDPVAELLANAQGMAFFARFQSATQAIKEQADISCKKCGDRAKLAIKVGLLGGVLVAALVW